METNLIVRRQAWPWYWCLVSVFLLLCSYTTVSVNHLHRTI